MDLISKRTARVLGLKRFYTGEPCTRGHDAERTVSEGACVVCKDENWRKWAANNPKDYAQHRRDGYERNREAILASGAKYRVENREKINARNREDARKKRDKAVAVLFERNLARALAGLPPIRKRKEAAALGEKHFYTGKPCRRGHVEVPRATNTGVCQECNREKAREFYAKYPERQRKWQRDNKDKMAGYVRKYQEKKKRQALLDSQANCP